MSIAVDCTELPSYTALRAAGVSGVLRYLSWLYRWGGVTHTYINPKIIQKAEYDGLTANGYGVALNWEYDYLDWLGGASAGTAHATEAVRQAKALGYPAGHVIYFSADFNMSRSQWDAAGHGYATAVATTVRAAQYLPGAYGPYDVLTWCRDAKVMDRFWQAGMATSWSGGRNANAWPGAHLRQRRHILIGGIDCDANDILISDYGQYSASPAPAPTPIPSKRGRRRMLLAAAAATMETVYLCDGATSVPVDKAVLGDLVYVAGQGLCDLGYMPDGGDTREWATTTYGPSGRRYIRLGWSEPVFGKVRAESSTPGGTTDTAGLLAALADAGRAAVNVLSQPTA